jgi:hypothetical protein
MIFSKPKAICLHGFLGTTDDFNPLAESFDILSLDLKPMLLSEENSYESWDQLISRIQTQFENYIASLDETDNVCIFSYSMGSKVLFSFFENIISNQILEKFKKTPQIALISTHFGIYKNDLEQNQEISDRHQMHQKYLDILAKSDLDLFLQAWNKISLFSYDKAASTGWSLNEINHYFKCWGQSQKKNIANLLKTNFNFLIFYGSEDIKYQQQSDRLKSLGLKNIKHFELKARSHRLLQTEDLNFISRKVLSEL